MENEEKIIKLAALIEKCNFAYRTGDYSWFDENGLVPPTDPEYDSMLEDLAVLDPTNPTLKKVGYEIPDENTERKQPLPIKMRSADKIKTIEELWKWLSRNNIPPDAFAVLSAKLDGLSLCVKEAHEPGRNNPLKKAWTRGDGSVGQTCDAHFAAIEPNSIDYPFYSLGEAIISRKNYDLYFKGKLNPRSGEPWGPARNVAAGRLNAEVPDQFIQYVDYIRFGLVNFDGTQMDKSAQIAEINRLNKVQLPYKVVRFREITSDLLDKLFKEWSHDYNIDGIIIDVDNADLRNFLGIHTSGKYPNYMVAYKDDNEEVVETKMRDIIIQISKNGYGIPVALIDPVMLDGAEVKRATCHNMKTVVDLQLGPGAVVKIKRSGFVIPKIIDVVKPGNYQEVLDRGCPICGSKMIWDEPNDQGEVVNIICSNPECDGRKYKRLLSFFKTLGVENVGPGVIDTLYNEGFTTVKDVIHMTLPALLKMPRFGERKAEIVYNSIAAKVANIPISKLQHASGYFTGLGSKMLAPLNQFINQNTPEDKLFDPTQRIITRDQIKSLDGFADKSADVYLNGIQAFWNWVNETGLMGSIDFFDGKPQKRNIMNNTLNGKGVVFTGFRSEELSEAVEEHGGVMKDGISKNSHILVMKVKGSGSGKEKKALSLGQEVYDIEEFQEKYLI